MSMMVSFVLSFFPRDVLDEILNLIESVSEDFPSYSLHQPWHLRPFRVHSNDLFSQTTASMNLTFHMQHDPTPRFQNNKI